jgi:4-hydroxybenzoate polyprenyltransferase
MGLHKLQKVTDYFSLVKISHTIFSLPFALVGFSLAVAERGENISLKLLGLVLLCVLFARNAAMGFNRYADREFDRRNPRTAGREIPSEVIKPASALAFVIVNAVLFMVASYFLNFLCFILSPVALFVILGYSLTKRFTSLSHIFLGLGLALAPIGAYLAVAARFDILPLVYSFVVLFWVAGFDILYALQDIGFDTSQNLKSLPVYLGMTRSLILSALLHLVAVALVIAAGVIGQGGLLFWMGTAIFTLILAWEHLIVKPGDISRINLAFATLNGLGSVVFAAFVIADLFIRH